MKYHINSKGVPAVCRAFKQPCPFGGNDCHYDTVEQAQEAADQRNEAEFGLLGNSEPFVNKIPENSGKFYNNDCSIISLGNSVGLTYTQADKVLRYIDYEDGEFVRRNKPRTKAEYSKMGNLTDFYSMLGERVEMQQLPTFGTFNMEGTYVIGYPGHAASSVDGVLYDSWDSSRAMVTWAYKIDEDRVNELKEFMSKHKIFAK